MGKSLFIATLFCSATREPIEGTGAPYSVRFSRNCSIMLLKIEQGRWTIRQVVVVGIVAPVSVGEALKFRFGCVGEIDELVALVFLVEPPEVGISRM